MKDPFVGSCSKADKGREGTRWYSASQLTLWLRCPRKWAFRYILGLKEPETESLRIGLAIHDEIDQWFKQGVKPPDARAQAALEGMPERGSRVDSEKPVWFWIKPQVIGFNGSIDLLDWRAPERPRIIDHKTTKHFKWAKTSFELAEDVQLNSYAAWVLGLWGDHPGLSAERIELTHNVIKVRGRKPEVQKTSAVVTREHVAQRWDKHLRVINEIETKRADTQDVTAFEPRGERNGHCEAFGGCPHIQICLAHRLGKVIDMKQFIEEPQSIVPPDATPSGELYNAGEGPFESLASQLQALKGRRDGVEAKMPEEVPPVAPPEADKPEVKKTKAKPRKAKPQKKKGEQIKTLYVDCAPLGQELMSLGQLMQPVEKAIADETGKSWMYAPFRDGPAMLLDGLDRIPSLPEALLVDSSTSLASILLDALVVRSKTVVRRIR